MAENLKLSHYIMFLILVLITIITIFEIFLNTNENAATGFAVSTIWDEKEIGVLSLSVDKLKVIDIQLQNNLDTSVIIKKVEVNKYIILETDMPIIGHSKITIHNKLPQLSSSYVVDITYLNHETEKEYFVDGKDVPFIVSPT